MPKSLKIQDPKLRKLLAKVKKDRSKKVAAKPAKTFHVKRSTASQVRANMGIAPSNLARAQSLLAELRAMGLDKRPAAPKRRKAVKRSSTLRNPSLPADHPFNRPRRKKAAKKRAKKTGKRTAVSALRIPSLPADHPFNRPRRKKAAKKRAKKTGKRAARKVKGPSHLPPALLRDLGFAAPAKKRAKKASKKRGKKASKKTVKRTSTFHVKRSTGRKKASKRSKKTSKKR